MWRGLVIAAVLMAGLAGCSSEPPAVDPNAPVVLISGPGDGAGADALVVGSVTVDDARCVGLDGRLTVWPDGTGWDSANDALRLPNGTLVRVGEAVTGGGFYASQEAAQATLADTSQAGRCQWGAEVPVFNPGSDVEKAN